MRTIIERAFTAHQPTTARYVGGWRRLWAAGLLCALAGTASGYVQDLEFEPTPGAIYAAAIAAGDWHKVIAALTESPNPSQSNDSRRRDECTS